MHYFCEYVIQGGIILWKNKEKLGVVDLHLSWQPLDLP